MADPMRIRAQAAGDKTTVRVLMSHEMETGQRKDSAGKVIPAWFIQEVAATHNGKAVFDLTDSVEANINTRVKMGQSSNVFAVAMMNDGKVLYAGKEIKVTLGGCGG